MDDISCAFCAIQMHVLIDCADNDDDDDDVVSMWCELVGWGLCCGPPYIGVQSSMSLWSSWLKTWTTSFVNVRPTDYEEFHKCAIHTHDDDNCRYSSSRHRYNTTKCAC